LEDDRLRNTSLESSAGDGVMCRVYDRYD